MKKPITAIIVGGGHRSFIYADYSIDHPDDLKIVGIADPDKSRVADAVKKYGIPEENCFESAQELAKHGKLADVIINGTMDKVHVETSIPLLECGYDMLLEKPFAVSKDEMKQLVDTVNKYIRELKDLYDETQKFSLILPVRKQSKREQELDKQV